MNKEWRNMLIFIGILFLVGWLFSSSVEDDGESPLVKINDSYDANIQEVKDDFPDVEETHWAHMPLTYSILDEEDCELIVKRMKEGMDVIEDATEGLVSFVETEQDADLTFRCVDREKMIEELKENQICKNISFDYRKETIFYSTESDLEESQLFLSGTRISMNDSGTIYRICYADLDDELAPNLDYDTLGEAAPIVSGDIITKGRVNMYKTDQGWITCSFPTREIHEILHTFSFGHSYEPYFDPYRGYGDLNLPYLKDILFPYSYCQYQKELNEKYSSCLKHIYSNGEAYGDCSEVNFLYEGGERVGECPEDSYITIDREYCCEEPNMYVDDEGYCDYA